MAADLQEPPELVAEFWRCWRLAQRREPRSWSAAAKGARTAWLDAASARLFWALYRRFVDAEVPPGGIDVFGCTRAVRDQLLALGETPQLAGGPAAVGRLPPRKRCPTAAAGGRSAARRGPSAASSTYLLDSVYSFSDLPIRWLMRAGIAGLCLSVVFSVVVLAARLSGRIEVPGYAASVLLTDVLRRPQLPSASG